MPRTAQASLYEQKPVPPTLKGKTMAVSTMKTNGHRLPRLRLLRRRAGPSQRDVAALLGHRSHSQISRYENGRRVPPADELLQLQVIFGVVPSGQFPQLQDKAAQTVVARIDKVLKGERQNLSQRAGQPSRRATHLQRVLDSIRRQLVPGLDAHEPWPTASTLEELEPSEP